MRGLQRVIAGRWPTAMLATTAIVVAGSAMLVLSPDALAQEKYPSRPLTIIVPTAPASSTDSKARLVATRMRARFGQPVVVENKPGAGGIIGVAYVAKARPDGYTILHSALSNLATAPGTVKALTFDPVQDFSGIMLSSEGYIALMTRGEFKGLTFPQFLDRMRKNPELFPVAGSNTGNEIFLKQIASAAGIPLTYVRYSDYGRMMTDLWGGRLGGALALLNLFIPPHKSGQGYIVAMSATERLPDVPGIPTMEEGLPGVNLASTSGYFAPATTPRPIINFLYAQIAETGKDPEVLSGNADGGRPLFTTPDETDAFMKKEVQRWTVLLKEAGIVPQ